MDEARRERGRGEGAGKKGTASSWTNSSRGRHRRYATAFHFRRFSSGPANEGHRYGRPVFDEFVCTFTRGRLYVPRVRIRPRIRGTSRERECDSRTRPDVAGASMHICTHAGCYIACTRIYSVANAIKPIDEITADRGPFSLSLSLSLFLFCWICTTCTSVLLPCFSSARCLKRRK